MSIIEFLEWTKQKAEEIDDVRDCVWFAIIPTISFVFWSKEKRAKFAKNYDCIKNSMSL